MSIGPVFRRLRHAKGWKLIDVVDSMGYDTFDPGQLSKIETGKTAPNVYIARDIARVLGASLDAVMMEADGGPPVRIVTDPLVRVPVLSWVQAGEWTHHPEALSIEQCDRWEIAPRPQVPFRTYALQVRGDSMQAPHGVSFPDGCFVLVNPNGQLDNKAFVIAWLDDSAEATFKQLVIDGPNKYLKPLNPQYPLLPITKDTRFCGTVFDYFGHL